MAGDITWQIEQLDGTSVATISDPQIGRMMHPARGEGPGSGQITVHRDHANYGDFDHLLAVTADVDGTDRFTFVLESRQTVRASEQEDAGMLARWEGRGLLAALGDVGLGGGVVYPEGGVSGADPRMFGWMDCSCFDDSGFVAPGMSARQDDPDPPWSPNSPEQWPDGAARRVWSQSPSLATSGDDEVQSHSLGTSINSGTFTVTFEGETSAAVGTPWAASDLETALEGLSTIDGVTVVGSGLDGDPYLVTFDGADVSKRDVELLTFDHSSLSHTPNTWTAAVVQEGAAGTYVTGKSCDYFRQEFTTAEDLSLILFVNMAKVGEVWIDGARIYEQTSSAAAKSTQAIPLDLPAGDHCLAARVCQKASSGLAWFMFTLAVAAENDDGTYSLGTVVARSGTSTVVSSTPVNSPPPGVTIGEILVCLIDEWQTRGGGAWLAGLGFDGDDDSDGTAWASTFNLALSVGTPYFQVVAQLEQIGGVLAELGPDRMLEVYQDELGASGQTFVEGTSILESPYTAWSPQANAILVASDVEFSEFVDAASVSAYGRLEASTFLGIQPAIEDLDTFASQTLNRTNEVRREVVMTVGPDAGGPQPYTDLLPGETLTAPDDDGNSSTWRLVAWSVENDEVGVYRRWQAHLREVGPSGS